LESIIGTIQSRTKSIPQSAHSLTTFADKSHPVADLLDSLARNPTRSQRTMSVPMPGAMLRERRDSTPNAQGIKPRAKDTSDLATERRGRPRRMSFHGYFASNKGSAPQTQSNDSFEVLLRAFRLLSLKHLLGMDSSARRASMPSTNVKTDPKTTTRSSQTSSLSTTDRKLPFEESIFYVGDEFSVQPSSLPIFLRRQSPRAEPCKVRFSDTRSSTDTASLKPVQKNPLDVQRCSSVDLKSTLDFPRRPKDSPSPCASSLESLELKLGAIFPISDSTADSLRSYPKRMSLSSDSEAEHSPIISPTRKDHKIVLGEPQARSKRASFFRDIFGPRNLRIRRNRVSRR
jgi:hypothetical protein